jgi:hypothetical protein
VRGAFFCAAGPRPSSSGVAEVHARRDERKEWHATSAAARSEIAGNASDFPIAIARWLGTDAAINFLAGRGLIQRTEAAALFGLGERPPPRFAKFAAASAANRDVISLIFRPLHHRPSWWDREQPRTKTCPGNPLWILAHMLGKVQLFVLEHVTKTLHDFFDKDMFQLFEMERFLFEHGIPRGREAL